LIAPLLIIINYIITPLSDSKAPSTSSSITKVF